jgi:two-component system cell cycle response regulator
MDARNPAGQGVPSLDQRPLTRRQVVGRVAFIITLAETFIMLALGPVQTGMPPIEIALLDAILLLAVSTGPIYFWVVRPFARAHEEAARAVGYLAYHDALTGLPNRRMLFEHLNRALAACERHGSYGAVLLLDLDGFKHINDRYGHEVGDEFLKQVADRLDEGKRKEDIVARLGGDEFVVLAQQLDAPRARAEKKAVAIARKLQQALLRPVIHGNMLLGVGCSIGIRLIEPQRISDVQSIREADIAMYDAKNNRDSSVRVFRPGATACPIRGAIQKSA